MTSGAAAEDAALYFLESQGLRLLERNFHSRFGEIDLIMRHGDALVFVEVRLRNDSNFGGAAESVTRRKQQRIILAARQYLTKISSLPPCRFDVVLLSRTRAPEWIKNAFME